MAGDLSSTFLSRSPDDTERWARSLAQHVIAPAVLLLEGPIGAGKSAFARAFIRALGVTDQDIPSPTFTLVQTYDSPAGEVWHSDLYRLSAVQEVDELGLFEAFEDAICLIEWPDRLADEAPDEALWITFSPGAQDEHRTITATARDPKWRKTIATLA